MSSNLVETILADFDIDGAAVRVVRELTPAGTQSLHLLVNTGAVIAQIDLTQPRDLDATIAALTLARTIRRQTPASPIAVTVVGDDGPITTTLAGFLIENDSGLDEGEAEDVVRTLGRGETYRGAVGGGGSDAWTIELAAPVTDAPLLAAHLGLTTQ